MSQENVEIWRGVLDGCSQRESAGHGWRSSRTVDPDDRMGSLRDTACQTARWRRTEAASPWQ